MHSRGASCEDWKSALQAEKIKVKVYVNQHESVSHIQIRHAYDFSLCFIHELLMSFLTVVTELTLLILSALLQGCSNKSDTVMIERYCHNQLVSSTL